MASIFIALPTLRCAEMKTIQNSELNIIIIVTVYAMIRLRCRRFERERDQIIIIICQEFPSTGLCWNGLIVYYN